MDSVYLYSDAGSRILRSGHGAKLRGGPTTLLVYVAIFERASIDGARLAWRATLGELSKLASAIPCDVLGAIAELEDEGWIIRDGDAIVLSHHGREGQSLAEARYANVARLSDPGAEEDAWDLAVARGEVVE